MEYPKMTLIKKISLVLIACMISANSMAEPRTAEVSITAMRPYTTGDYFVTVSSSAMATGPACTTVYKVQASDPGAKSVIASLLTVYALGGTLQIEVPTATGCEGFGTPIQSVFLN